ncbi:glycosyltransferase family 2 protein [Actinomycetospora aeridis]|uniref:glycosyltransferase family 2 protein n=1 Tax=Actinomycetospora aeridis TaxID=3129231 RepID=UPI00359F6847
MDSLGCVAAIIVSFNRRQTLIECLTSLTAQSRPLDLILVIDNGSTDGTVEEVQRDFPRVALELQPYNRGGAGGFSEGVNRALQAGCDYVWLMDDDVVPDHQALEKLRDGLDAYPASRRPVLATSLVLDAHQNLGPRNRCVPSRDYAALADAAAKGHLAIRASSFVAPLIDLSVSAQTALPIADYFIWHDDTEYTTRVCQHGGGILVPASTVVHYAAAPAPGKDLGLRLFYDVRNRAWMARNREIYSLVERLYWARGLVELVLTQARVATSKARFARVVVSALWAARTRPRTEMPYVAASKDSENALESSA